MATPKTTPFTLDDVEYPMTWSDRLRVTVPPGSYRGLAVQKFEVKAGSTENFELRAQGRQTKPGTYTRLVDIDTNTFWMSDTDAERRDHAKPVLKMGELKAERVIINGLGLGMVLNAALSFDHVQHVDVVEIDPRVVHLVGQHYAKDPRVHIHIIDAYDYAAVIPRGTQWDVGWSDVWSNITWEEHLTQMQELHKRYVGRCLFHGCWGKEALSLRRRSDMLKAKAKKG